MQYYEPECHSLLQGYGDIGEKKKKKKKKKKKNQIFAIEFGKVAYPQESYFCAKSLKMTIRVRILVKC